MDPMLSPDLFHMGDPEGPLSHAAPSSGFTGLVDEFIVFGGPAGFNDQHLSRSLFDTHSIDATGGLYNSPDVPLHTHTNPHIHTHTHTQSLSHTPMTSSRQLLNDFGSAHQFSASATLNQPMAVLDLLDSPDDEVIIEERDEKPRCWEHGCNGREFSSKSNLMRHMKEKSGASNKCTCPLCGAIFTRSSARDTHLAKQSCNKIRRYSNGRPRPSRLAVLENPRAAAAAAAAATSVTLDQIQWQMIDRDMATVGNRGSGGDAHMLL